MLKGFPPKELARVGRPRGTSAQMPSNSVGVVRNNLVPPRERLSFRLSFSRFLFRVEPSEVVVFQKATVVVGLKPMVEIELIKGSQGGAS
jgi:hypothetical protein